MPIHLTKRRSFAENFMRMDELLTELDRIAAKPPESLTQDDVERAKFLQQMVRPYILKNDVSVEGKLTA